VPVICVAYKRRVWMSHVSRICSCCMLHKWVTSTYHTVQRTATHCNTLQHTATYCNVLQHTCYVHIPHTVVRLQHRIASCNIAVFACFVYRVANRHQMPCLYKSLSSNKTINSGSFAERDLQLKGSYASPPLCTTSLQRERGRREGK